MNSKKCICVARYRQHQCFLFSNNFFKLIITKDSLIDSWSIYNLIRNFLKLNLIYITNLIVALGMSKQEDFHRPKKPLEKTRETDKEARMSKATEAKRKFNRNQKRITPWEIELSSQIFLIERWYLLGLFELSMIFVIVLI